MIRIAFVALAVLLMLAASAYYRNGRDFYQGRSAGEWVRLAESNDKAMSETAIRALGHLEGNQKAADELHNVLFYRWQTTGKTILSTVAIYRHTGEATPLIPIVRDVMREHADTDEAYWVDDMRELTEVMPDAAKQLIPDLLYIRSRVKQEGSRRKIGELIDLMQ